MDKIRVPYGNADFYAIMTQGYYYVDRTAYITDDVDRLFGHLAIGRNPTPLHNRYLIMRWDFSMVSSSGSGDEMKRELSDHINGCIFEFKTRYQDIYRTARYLRT